MSDSLRPQVLHVDDDAEAREQAREYLEKQGIEKWGQPEVTGIGAFDEAMSILETRRFDAMLLDVRLGGHEPRDAPPGEEAGVRTLQEIRARRFLPVVFWTGLPSKVRDLEGPLVRVVDKGDASPLASLGTALRETFATDMPLVNRALLRLIEDEQRSYMWDFVAPHWQELQEAGDHLSVAYLLARRLGRSLSGSGIRELAATIGDIGLGELHEDGVIHPVEMYIVPPIATSDVGVADLMREPATTGLGHWWLVVTPTCDLANNKADGVILAPCVPLGDHPAVRALEAKNNSDTRSAVKSLLKQATDGQRDRYLYLPAAPTLPALVVDFQRLKSVSRAELQEMERRASLVSPFAEAVVSRFVRYFGRVGTSDLPVDALFAELQESLGQNAGPAPSDAGA